MSTVGRHEAMIRNQEQENQRWDQMNLWAVTCHLQYDPNYRDRISDPAQAAVNGSQHKALGLPGKLTAQPNPPLNPAFPLVIMM